jgi:hypothetical protein
MEEARAVAQTEITDVWYRRKGELQIESTG